MTHTFVSPPQGRALLGLKQYSAAAEAFQHGLALEPAHGGLQEGLHQAETLRDLGRKPMRGVDRRAGSAAAVGPPSAGGGPGG